MKMPLCHVPQGLCAWKTQTLSPPVNTVQSQTGHLIASRLSFLLSNAHTQSSLPLDGVEMGDKAANPSAQGAVMRDWEAQVFKSRLLVSPPGWGQGPTSHQLCGLGDVAPSV